MPRRAVQGLDDFDEWCEQDYTAETDSDSGSESDLESTRTNDLEDSETESTWSSSSDANTLDLEEIQAELATLSAPLCGIGLGLRTRRLSQKKIHRNQILRRQTSRSQSPLATVGPSTSNKKQNFQSSEVPISTAATTTAAKQSTFHKVTSTIDRPSNLASLHPNPRQPTEVIEISSNDDSDTLEEAVNQTRPSAPKLSKVTHAKRRKGALRRPAVFDRDDAEHNKLTKTQNLSEIIDIDEEVQSVQRCNNKSQLPTPGCSEEEDYSGEASNSLHTDRSGGCHLNPHPASLLTPDNFEEIEKHDLGGGHLLMAGMTVERMGMAANGERSVFKVIQLLKHKEEQAIYVEGRRFVFTSTLPHVEGSDLGQRNEVTAVIVECKLDKRSSNELERFPVDEVVRTWQLKLFAPNSQGHAEQRYTNSHGELFCKSVLFLQYKDSNEWQRGQTKTAGVLRLVKPEEADDPVQTSKLHKSAQQTRKENQPYTFIDACSSIGGASEAAELAGLNITDAIEIDTLRAGIYMLNFPRTTMHVEDILDPSLKFNLSDLFADLLHISMTCRFWSKAHTTPGKMDEQNRALLHEIPKLIDRIRPRQVTVEQVPNLLSPTHYGDFIKLVFGILVLGYSVSWDLINFEELGGTAKRQRLVLLASAPSEALPPWPKATHGPGLKPFITAREALKDMYIPRGSKPDKRLPRGNTILCDPDKLFSITLVRKRHPIKKINGKEHKVLHWDNRPFTPQELARFQQLSQYRHWAGNDTERCEMIGDAVPAVPFSEILKTVVSTLKETDAGGSISRSQYDRPYAITQPALPPFARKRLVDSELPDLEQLFTHNVLGFRSAVSRSHASQKRSAASEPSTLPYKKHRRRR